MKDRKGEQRRFPGEPIHALCAWAAIKSEDCTRIDIDPGRITFHLLTRDPDSNILIKDGDVVRRTERYPIAWTTESEVSESKGSKAGA